MNAKSLLLYIGLLFSMFFVAACQPFGGQPFDVTGVVKETVRAVDRDQDGQVTNREIKDAKNDPNVYIAVGTALLGLLGLMRGQQAHQLAAKVERETDEQWEKLP